MRKNFYKLLPLILVFVFLFSSVAMATDDVEEVPLYGSVYDDWYMELIYVCIDRYYSDTNSSEEIFVYAVTLAVDSSTLHRANVYIGPRSSSPGNGGDATVFTYPDQIYNYRISQSDGGAISLYSSSIVDSVTLSTNSNAKYQVIYVSQDIYDDYGTLYYQSPNPLYSEVEEDNKNDKDYIFDIFDSFQDFTQQSNDFNDYAQKQTVTENSNSPNDGIFQNIFQSISGLINIGNSITQQISGQLQNFMEQFFNNFAQNALGLLNEIKDSLFSLVDNILPDNLNSVIDHIYESGLDSDGNFGLDTFFDFWFIPEEDYFGTIFNQLSSDRTGLFQVFDIMDYMKSGLLNIEPTAPVIRIPGGTYGFLTVPDIELGFTWFEVWKPYTDPLIAAFLYVTYTWHLILQIPGILSGSAGTVASGNHYESNEIRRENNERLRGR